MEAKEKKKAGGHPLALNGQFIGLAEGEEKPRLLMSFKNVKWDSK